MPALASAFRVAAKRSSPVRLTLVLAVAAATAFPSPVAGDALVHHRIGLVLDPAAGRIAVEDELTLPPGQAPEFVLNANLAIERSTPELEEIPVGDVSFFSINADLPRGAKLKRYRTKTPPVDGKLSVAYSGPFDFGLSDQKEEYTRGFRETAGVVSKDGVYLAGSGFWYPYFGPALVEFALEVKQPAGWHSVSQGNGTSRDAEGVARWESHGAMDEIYVVGGPLVVYREQAGNVEALAYLREKDDALAAKYLSATAQYLEMYRSLIGAYPYGKFALVENFWETGYGMPSFTLLGPQIIRFPFILTSSYPHEILHNWWGNSVFVDYETGNWCEGLTAYLADHLIQEQRGRGAEYRQDTLKKYRDYVKAGRDFPLREFRSRHSAATEAIGYGRTAMGFHMLRLKLGDDAFRKALQRLYREQRGKKASFDDVRKVFEAVSGQDLGRFFADWVQRPGAAELAVRDTAVTPAGGGWQLAGTLEQTQPGAPFALDVPLVVQTAQGATPAKVALDGPQARFTVALDAEPLVLHVDPAFDLFRRLDPRETPSSIGQVFGEPKILALLPSSASAAEQAAYRELLKGWQSDAHAIEVRLDREVEALPADRAAWLLGRDNLWAKKLFAKHGAGATRVTYEGAEAVDLAGHTAVLTTRHPHNVEKAVGWIAIDPPAAFPGLGRKLPHYGKYSYLGFEGAEPANTIKGQWAGADSPLRVDLRPPAARAAALPPLALPARQALAELPPVFSQKALMEHVAFLAAPEREGRGLGSEGLAASARYVADQFQKMGLAPGGDGGTYFQKFTVGGLGAEELRLRRSPQGTGAGFTPASEPAYPRGTPVEAVNVIGVLPGTKPELAGQSAVISAHYDHLGRGWPDARKEHEGQLHPGADDNASGVAVLLELARAAASAEKPARTLVFAAFSAEEAGLQGSQHYVAHPLFPLDKTIGVLNLDTVGRLGSQKLQVLGTGTASEWQHIFRGASFVTGVESQNVPGTWEASDQASFIRKGVPGVQVFSGPHADYHRPGDTLEKVDGAGLVKVATFAKEAVAYLGERPTPLTVTIAGTAPAPPAGGAPRPAGAPAGRRVSLGTMPDFAFAGPGMKVAAVTPGSPAEKAGLRAGDVIVRLDGQEVASLQAYSDALKKLQPGQAIEIVVTRDGQESTLTATVVER
jgi:hypothetical protein